MTFRIKVVEDWSFDKYLSQFGKGRPSSECEKAGFHFFKLRQILGFKQIFGLGHFLTFLLNLIVSNLSVIKLTSINLTSVTSSFAVNINPDSTFFRLCSSFNIPQSFQYRGKWYSYLIKSLDELSIKVCKSAEDLDISYWLGLRLLLDCLNFFVLYTNAL